MAEYIEREALNKIIDREIDICNSGMIRGELEYLKAIVPVAADVVEVKRGRWVQVIYHVEFEDGFVDRLCECCSRCHEPNGRRTSDFCPNCGADMREGDPLVQN